MQDIYSVAHLRPFTCVVSIGGTGACSPLAAGPQTLTCQSRPAIPLP